MPSFCTRRHKWAIAGEKDPLGFLRYLSLTSIRNDDKHKHLTWACWFSASLGGDKVEKPNIAMSRKKYLCFEQVVSRFTVQEEWFSRRWLWFFIFLLKEYISLFIFKEFLLSEDWFNPFFFKLLIIYDLMKDVNKNMLILSVLSMTV